jgi:hypothetical protein
MLLLALSPRVLAQQQQEEKKDKIPSYSIHLVSGTEARLDVALGYKHQAGTELTLWTHQRTLEFAEASRYRILHNNDPTIIQSLLETPLTYAGFIPKFEKMPLEPEQLSELSKAFRNQVSTNLLVNSEIWKALKPPVTTGLFGYVHYKEGIVSKEGPMLLRGSLHLFIFDAEGKPLWSFHDPGYSPQDGIEIKVLNARIERKKESWLLIQATAENLNPACADLRKVLISRFNAFFKPFRFVIHSQQSQDPAVEIQINLLHSDSIQGLLLREDTEHIMIQTRAGATLRIQKEQIDTLRRSTLKKTHREALDALKEGN